MVALRAYVNTCLLCAWKIYFTIHLFPSKKVDLYVFAWKAFTHFHFVQITYIIYINNKKPTYFQKTFKTNHSKLNQQSKSNQPYEQPIYFLNKSTSLAQHKRLTILIHLPQTTQKKHNRLILPFDTRQHGLAKKIRINSTRE